MFPDEFEVSSITKLKQAKQKYRLMLMVGVFLFIGSLCAIAFIGFAQHEDSGVQACNAMADRFKHPSNHENAPMTDDQYHKMRKPFEDSSYVEIQVAGTNVVDTVYKSQGKIDTMGFAEAIDLSTTLKSQWSSLQVACGKQGVKLPGLG